ncbi:hypothetical protein G6H54_002866 [Listeria monocytogenes]|nr:hypothetical protein [Listeria monocytogenes]EEO9090080.1 hypothetical protein [Listeria monocytogenes]
MRQSMRKRMEREPLNATEKYLFSISLSFGNTTNWIKKGNEVNEVGRAASKVYGVYKKMLLKEKGIQVSLAVDAISTTIYGEADEKDFKEILEIIKDDLFENSLFEKAKLKAIKDLKQNYTDIEYRAIFKSYELIYFEQQFNFKDYIASHEKISIENIINIQENLVNKNNIYIFIYGDNSEKFLQEYMLSLKETKADIVFPKCLDMFPRDYKIKLIGERENGMLTVKFNKKTDTQINSRKEYLCLMILGYFWFQKDYVVYTEFKNSSILALNTKIAKVDLQLKKLTKAMFFKIVESIKEVLNKRLSQKNNSFTLLMADLKAKGIDKEHLIKDIEQLNIEDVQVYIKEKTDSIQYGQVIFEGRKTK